MLAALPLHPAAAQGEARSAYEFALPSLPLSQAIRRIATQTGLTIVAPAALLRGRTAPAINGSLSADEAVTRALTGTDLSYVHSGNAIVIERSGEANVEASSGAPAATAITVTGTRIRGAPVASPVIDMSQQQIRESGGATLAEAVRTLPQNFGGGQNPGIGNNVPATSGVNVGSSTSVNLRGLGSDATLTLLNGHRLSYSASRQAVDISSIPLGAVDRIEIVPDGASALYGSDAVAGVVNVILKHDYQGLEASGRLGSSTDGGDFEQRYGLVTGTRWGSGGLIATYEFGRSTAILGRNRSYAAGQSPGVTLFPLIRNHTLLLSGHQDLTSTLSFQIDALYNNRFSRNAFALNSAGNLRQSGIQIDYRTNSLLIAPTLRFAPGSSWNLFLTGSYGRDHTHYDLTSYFAGTPYHFGGNCYCNSARSLEAGGDGTVFALPAGAVRLAVGAGYRANRLVRFNGTGAVTNISKTQSSYYGYGELSVPVIAPEQQFEFARRISLSAALRYEHYRHVGAIAAPKLGLIYEPAADFSIKTSWGRSFRAPTLYQQYSASDAVLEPPSDFGGTGFPPGTTALLVEGGNPHLKPERATSWSATLDVHPRSIRGFNAELSWFDTRYRDRVVTPISYLSQALDNPIYADHLTLNPGSALVENTIASASYFANVTGAPFNPATVAVLIDNRNVNAAYQNIHGVDLLLRYETQLPKGWGNIGGDVNATYLDSAQQLGPRQPLLPLAGQLFDPPHWRARADIHWRTGPVTLTGDVNYLGGVEDRRYTPAVHVGGMTTVDMTLLVRSRSRSGPLRGTEVGWTVQNLFNIKPARIATTLPSDTPYDSTNYSPVGRFIAVSLSKSW